MRTVEKLEELTALAERMGYQIRYEPLAGTGGVCEYGGKRWLFVDLNLTVTERLDLITDALMADPSLPVTNLSDELYSHFGFSSRKNAA